MAFFTDYLMTQQHASPHTIASYRDWLLLTFARQRSGKLPAQLDLADLDAVLIGTLQAANEQLTLSAALSASRNPTHRPTTPAHRGMPRRVGAKPRYE